MNRATARFFVSKLFRLVVYVLTKLTLLLVRSNYFVFNASIIVKRARMEH